MNMTPATAVILGQAVSLGQPIKSKEDYIYSDPTKVFVIDRDLDVGDRIIRIAARSIHVPLDVTITAKEIEFDTTEGVFCIGKLACSVLRTYAPKDYILEESYPDTAFIRHKYNVKSLI